MAIQEKSFDVKNSSSILDLLYRVWYEYLVCKKYVNTYAWPVMML